MLDWPERCKLAHAFLSECSQKGLELAQLLLGQLGVFLTCESAVGVQPSTPNRKALWVLQRLLQENLHHKKGLPCIGTALSKKIGIYESSSVKVVPITPNKSYASGMVQPALLV